MANPTLSLQPSFVDLKLYAGDGVNLTLIVNDEIGDPIELDGVVLAQIRDKRVGGSVQLDFDVAVDGPGAVTISIPGTETTTLLGSATSFKGVWDVQWTGLGREPLTLVQGNVRMDSDVTR